MSLSIGKQPILFSADEQFGSFRIFPSQVKQFIDVGFAISHADQHGVGTLALDFSNAAEALQPFVAFLLLNSPLLALMFLTKLGPVPRPALHIQQTQRRAL